VAWEQVAPAPPVASAATFDAKEFAARVQSLRPNECEAAAREVFQVKADDAWTAMKICAKKKDFRLLSALLADPWVEVVKHKSDGIKVLARVIANRGGAVATDLDLVQQQKVPLFSLQSALAQPAVYKGQYVLVRAKVSDVKVGAGTPTLALAEFDYASTVTDVQVGNKYVSNSASAGGSSTSYNARGSASATTTHFGSGSVSGSVSGTSQRAYSGSSTSSSATTRQNFDNIAQETGRLALGKLAKPDPFLEVSKDFIFLGKFESTRRTDEGEEGTPLGVFSVIEYWEPSPLGLF